ncbi:hypothetical protein QJS10_CPA06g00432 [Acorus calamus]|uniref:Uncharacterized protein n=1 Tax=Acorus calamus TaxID=4465 RepID=A0AAV9EPK0_ACOCL|nr:hypothetical protein QJS10_CPA06g00432 [Acorus calamus]
MGNRGVRRSLGLMVTAEASTRRAMSMVMAKRRTMTLMMRRRSVITTNTTSTASIMTMSELESQGPKILCREYSTHIHPWLLL